jgi:hypothetical protein
MRGEKSHHITLGYLLNREQWICSEVRRDKEAVAHAPELWAATVATTGKPALNHHQLSRLIISPYSVSTFTYKPAC